MKEKVASITFKACDVKPDALIVLAPDEVALPVEHSHPGLIAISTPQPAFSLKKFLYDTAVFVLGLVIWFTILAGVAHLLLGGK